MPLAPQPRRRTDAPRAVSPRGVGLSAQSQHLALACGRRRCVSTPHWRTPRHLSGALATLSQHMLALRPSQSTVDVCNKVGNGGCV
jgi:hypothetical protein